MCAPTGSEERAMVHEHELEYAGYRVHARKPEGFLVVKNGTNPMPGATWFRTERDAQMGIDVLEAVGGDGKRFWHLMRALQWAKGE